VLGSDFSNLGTAPKTLTAGADNAKLIGSAGNDTLSSAAFTGVVMRSGAGDDILVINGSEKRVDGGGGNNTLRLATSGQNLDFTALADNKITGIGNVDLRGAGTNTLSLTARDLLDLSATTHALLVRGDSGDSVVSAGQGWVQGTDQLNGGVTYHSYTIANSAAHLLIESTIANLTIT
jgi:hypothetical protein